METKITHEQIREYASKTSHEWWQVAMQRFNTLSEEEKEKYKQFIRFNDFSDVLMNELIRALDSVVFEHKLVYEEGSLWIPECENKGPFPLETETGNNNMTY